VEVDNGNITRFVLLLCYVTVKECDKMNKDFVRTSLYMNKKEYERVKDYCAQKGISVNGLIKVLLDRYMIEVGCGNGK
jgi:hypothetical protein